MAHPAGARAGGGVTRPLPDRAGLPPAARRWLDRCLPAATPTPARVTVKQVGKLESNERWLRFRATGPYWAQPLAFEWRARLGIMLGRWAMLAQWSYQPLKSRYGTSTSAWASSNRHGRRFGWRSQSPA